MKYEKYYSETLARNRSALVSGFAQREFQDLNELMAANERLEGSYLRNVFQMSSLHLNIFKYSTNQNTVGKVLAKHGPRLTGLCDESDRANQKKMSKINVDIRQFKALQLGKPRD